MIRILHALAICGLISSAVYAYSIKYEALYFTEQIAKLKAKVQRERDAIAVVKAEWALLNRPERLQKMVQQKLDLQPMDVKQLARLADIPNRPDRGDEIARKLESLGLGEPTTTPKDKRPGEARTPSSHTPSR
jgi:hypothetical protein